MGGENEEEKALDLICAVSNLRHRLFPEGGGVQVSINSFLVLIML
jgi:hypothetical protein